MAEADYRRLVSMIRGWPDAEAVEENDRALRLQLGAAKINVTNPALIDANHHMMVESAFAGLLRPMVWLIARDIDRRIQRSVSGTAAAQPPEPRKGGEGGE